MTLQKLFIAPLILTLGAFPFTMNSADIYEKARGNGKIIANLNQNIITDDDKLKTTVFIISTKEEYKAPGVFSSCRNSQKLALSDKMGGNFIYIIDFSYDGDCTDNKVYVRNGDEIYMQTMYEVNMLPYSKNFTDSADLSDDQISEKIAKYDINSFRLDNEIFGLRQKKDLPSKIILIQKLYIQKFEAYENVFLSNLLSSRERLRYISPVANRLIPIKKNIIPNAGRPYRAKYTDGTHHGWDIFAPRGTPVRALADGVIIRVSNGFSWSRFDEILWKDLTKEDKAKNLDIYRGNQVWLKAADGNVVFYSHLDQIPSDMKQGQFVKAGTFLGKIDRSGVPDKEYKDFHLHFEVQVNPHDKVGYSFSEIMNWRYFGEGQSYNQIIAGETRLFAAGVISSK